MRLSVLEHEIPKLKGRDYYELSRLHLGRADISRANALMLEILLHEAYFLSFGGGEYEQSSAVREAFGSEQNLLAQLYGMASVANGGFVGVARKGGALKVFNIDDYSVAFDGKIILALDVAEHAYFGDYEFNRDRYLRYALKYLNISMLESVL